MQVIIFRLVKGWWLPKRKINMVYFIDQLYRQQIDNVYDYRIWKITWKNTTRYQIQGIPLGSVNNFLILEWFQRTINHTNTNMKLTWHKEQFDISLRKCLNQVLSSETWQLLVFGGATSQQCYANNVCAGMCRCKQLLWLVFWHGIVA